MKSYEVSELQANLAGILDEASKSEEMICVTRDGVLIARIQTVIPRDPGPRQPLFGSMKGTVTILGDIIEPIDAEWEVLSEDPDPQGFYKK